MKITLNIFAYAPTSSEKKGVYVLTNVNKDETYYVDFTIVSRQEYMKDSSCNKFYWKRTK